MTADRIQQLRTEASESIQREDWASALPLLDELLSVQPGNGAALYNKGVAHLKLAQYALAAQEFRQAVALRPDDPNARESLEVAEELLKQEWTEQAAADIAREDWASAAAIFTRWIACWPLDHLGYYNRALADVRRQEYEHAKADLDHALALQPDDPHILDALHYLDEELQQSTPVNVSEPAPPLTIPSATWDDTPLDVFELVENHDTTQPPVPDESLWEPWSEPQATPTEEVTTLTLGTAADEAPVVNGGIAAIDETAATSAAQEDDLVFSVSIPEAGIPAPDVEAEEPAAGGSWEAVLLPTDPQPAEEAAPIENATVVEGVTLPITLTQLLRVGGSFIHDVLVVLPLIEDRDTSAQVQDTLEGRLAADIEMGLGTLREAARLEDTPTTHETLSTVLAQVGEVWYTLALTQQAADGSTVDAPRHIRAVAVAEEYLTESLAARENAPAYYYRGMLFANCQRRLSDAVPDWCRALELDPAGEIGTEAANQLLFTAATDRGKTGSAASAEIDLAAMLLQTGQALVSDALLTVNLSGDAAGNAREQVILEGELAPRIELGLAELREARRRQETALTRETLATSLARLGLAWHSLAQAQQTLIALAKSDEARAALTARCARAQAAAEGYLGESLAVQGSIVAFYHRGMLLAQATARVEEALADLQQALALDPEGDLGMEAAKQIIRMTRPTFRLLEGK